MLVRRTHFVRERPTSRPQATVPHEIGLPCLPPFVSADNSFHIGPIPARFSATDSSLKEINFLRPRI